MAEEPDEVAIINPAVSAHRKNTPSQDKPDVVEASPPVSETVTGEETPSSTDRVVIDAEQTAPEMIEVPEALQPVVEAPQETLDPADEASSFEEAGVIEEEQTTPEMDRISDVPQPIAEVPQEMWDPEKETYSPEETVLSEEEVVTEMEYNPYTQEPIDAESTLEGSVSIETLPAQIPEQEDQASVTIDLFPEIGVQELVSTPVE